MKAAAPTPVAARIMCAAPCQRFSSCFEEECPVATDAASETSIASANACPISGFDQPDTSFSTVGIQ